MTRPLFDEKGFRPQHPRPYLAPAVTKLGARMPVSIELLLDDPWFAAAHPWLRPDPNPFPRIRLFRWLPA